MINLVCPYCGNQRGLIINVDFKARQVLGGICIKRRLKGCLKRKFKATNGCGKPFFVVLKSKQVING